MLCENSYKGASCWQIQAILHSGQIMLSYRFPCSIGSNQHSQRIKESDYLFVFILNSKAPHTQDAHFVYFRHVCFLKEEDGHKSLTECPYS